MTQAAQVSRNPFIHHASDSSLTHFSASQLAEMIRKKQCSPVETVDACLRRIQEVNPKLNAFAAVEEEKARHEARQAEDAIMAREVGRPLLGVPITIKSCIDVRGFRCEAGSRLRAGMVAAQDATLVRRLRAAGAIIIGNTTTPEALVAYHTENRVEGRTNNPWDLDRTPGGSSGGEAAAIASGMSAAGIGSDGGGSIRVPAHFCGICGLKPTPGRIPATGHNPACGGPFSLIGVVGPMARSVDDLELLLEVTSGYDPGDPVSSPLSLTSRIDSPTALRIGFYDDDGYNSPVPEVKIAVRAAANALEEAGFQVEEFRPQGLERARELWFTIFVEAIAMTLAPAVKGHESDLSDSTKNFLEFAAQQPPLTAESLLSTLLERDTLRLSVLTQMEHYPILLSPVCSIPAFLHQDAGWGSAHAADYSRTMSYSQHYNLLGNPALSLPVARTESGLPVGVQVIGRPYKEEEVLAVARIIERQFGSGHD